MVTILKSLAHLHQPRLRAASKYLIVCTCIGRHPEWDAGLFRLMVKSTVSGVRLSSNHSLTVTAAGTLNMFLNIIASQFPHLKSKGKNDESLHERLGELMWITSEKTLSTVPGHRVSAHQILAVFITPHLHIWIGPLLSVPLTAPSAPTEVSRDVHSSGCVLPSAFSQAILHYPPFLYTWLSQDAS